MQSLIKTQTKMENLMSVLDNSLLSMKLNIVTSLKNRLNEAILIDDTKYRLIEN